jgi:hypothetical protein
MGWNGARCYWKAKNLGRPTCLWEDNIKINILKIVWVWTGVI